MDNKLLNEFNHKSTQFISIINLSELEISKIQNSIVDKFSIDLNRNWCWEHISINHKTIEYDNADGLEKIKELLVNDITVQLIVTDETPPPWFGFKGKLFDLMEILKKLRYFEFFIVDEECSWIIFDTHHNSLIFIIR